MEENGSIRSICSKIQIQLIIPWFISQEVLDFWLKQGVSGFKLENIEYLLEDVELKNETISSRAGHMHDEYEFYNHQHTAQAPGIAKILDIWGATVHNHTGG